MRPILGVVLACCAPWSVEAVAQSVIRGVVRNESTGRPVPNAMVAIEGAATIAATTDAAGTFTLVGIAAGVSPLSVRLSGYRPLRATVELTGRDTLDLDIDLAPLAQSLPPIDVTTETRRRRQDVILADEIDEAFGRARDAYELIQQLRPSYLRGRGASNLGDPTANPLNPQGVERHRVRPLPPVDTSAMQGPGREIERDRQTRAARNPRLHLPRVSIDDGPLEDLDVLRLIPVRQIREIRLMSAIDAATRYGTGVEGGVLHVTLK